MSNYHILKQNTDKEKIEVVFHFPVPQAATNEADVLYTDIVKVSEELVSSLVGFQADFPVEFQEMQDGKVIERRKIIQLSSATLTPAQKLDEILNGNYLWEGYNAFKTNLFNDLQIVWEWYGKNGDVA